MITARGSGARMNWLPESSRDRAIHLGAPSPRAPLCSSTVYSSPITPYRPTERPGLAQTMQSLECMTSYTRRTTGHVPPALVVSSSRVQRGTWGKLILMTGRDRV